MSINLTTLTIDGVAYELSNFSEGIQNAAQLLRTLQVQQHEAQIEVMKCTVSVQHVSEQIRNALKAELAQNEKVEEVVDTEEAVD